MCSLGENLYFLTPPCIPAVVGSHLHIPIVIGVYMNKRIMTLEEELKMNTTKIHLKQDNNEYDLEYREIS